MTHHTGSDEGRRVVLVKPGDVLLIGNVGSNIDPEATVRLLGDLKRTLGLSQIAVFDEDIDIDAIPRAALAERPTDGAGT